MPERDDFLTAVAAQLPLPQSHTADVIEELAAHIDDTAAKLRATGLDPRDAEREAVRRLGPPDQLAERIARAQQTRARLLAGAGAGAVAAGVHGIGGLVIGLAYAFLGGIVLGIVVQALGRLFGTGWVLQFSDQGWNTLLLATGLNVGAFAAGRAGVIALAGTSRRELRSVRGWTAAIGSLVLLPIVLFGLRLPLNSASAVALLLVPIAFALGAVRPARVAWLLGRRAAVPVAVALALSLLLLLAAGGTGDAGGGRSEEYASPEEYWARMHFDRIGRQLPPGDEPTEFVGAWSATGATIHVEVQHAVPPLIPTWRDVRFEAWRALPDSAGVDPAYHEPLAIAPPEPGEARLQADLTLNRTPGVGAWVIALTGVGRDGERYVLETLGGGHTTFEGSVWEWFTLPRQDPVS